MITNEALHGYPNECCGFLLGYEKENERIVAYIVPCENISAVKENSFLISSDDYKKAEKTSEEKGCILLGIYHSHPNCEAVPSATDVSMALPYFSYLIVSVLKDKSVSARSWQLNNHSFFEEEKITSNQNIVSKNKRAYGNHNYSNTSA